VQCWIYQGEKVPLRSNAVREGLPA
jgi:hypothetical protein